VSLVIPHMDSSWGTQESLESPMKDYNVLRPTGVHSATMEHSLLTMLDARRRHMTKVCRRSSGAQTSERFHQPAMMFPGH
jgi:hypothetical protein